MIGVITLSDINAIFDEYGLQIAIKATCWKGTYLSFLYFNNLI